MIGASTDINWPLFVRNGLKPWITAEMHWICNQRLQWLQSHRKCEVICTCTWGGPLPFSKSSRWHGGTFSCQELSDWMAGHAVAGALQHKGIPLAKLLDGWWWFGWALRGCCGFAGKLKGKCVINLACWSIFLVEIDRICTLCIYIYDYICVYAHILYQIISIHIPLLWNSCCAGFHPFTFCEIAMLGGSRLQRALRDSKLNPRLRSRSCLTAGAWRWAKHGPSAIFLLPQQKHGELNHDFSMLNKEIPGFSHRIACLHPKKLEKTHGGSLIDGRPEYLAHCQDDCQNEVWKAVGKWCVSVASLVLKTGLGSQWKYHGDLNIAGQFDYRKSFRNRVWKHMEHGNSDVPPSVLLQMFWFFVVVILKVSCGVGCLGWLGHGSSICAHNHSGLVILVRFSADDAVVHMVTHTQS